MTGEHAERAGETALAIDCFEQAGREAQKRYANTAAVAWLRRALNLLGASDPGRRFDLLSELQSIADTVGDRTAQDDVHAEMATLLERHPDEVRQARLWFSLGMLADRRGDRAAAERYTLQACEGAERCSAAQTAALAYAMRVWLHIARHEDEAAREFVAPGLRWAAMIEDAAERGATEARLLTLSGMVATRQTRYDEARETLLGVLARGEALGLPRVQLGALDNLAVVDAVLARWDEVQRWGERMLELAQATGNLPYVVKAQWRLTRAAMGRDDGAAARHWCERNLPLARATGDRLHEAVALRQLGNFRREDGDAAAGRELNLQARDVFRAIDLPLMACEAAAFAAQCELALDLHDAARATVDEVLAALEGELAQVGASETMAVRFMCHQVLEPLGDARAAGLVERVHADLHAKLSSLPDSAERERAIAASSTYSGIVAAYRRRREEPTAAD
jgi:tetratricopeptide (TPR) repeat protein